LLRACSESRNIMVSRIPLCLRSKAPEEIRFSSDDTLWIKGLQNLVYYKLLVTFEEPISRFLRSLAKSPSWESLSRRVGRRDVLFPIFRG
jgi:hypothetical protein